MKEVHSGKQQSWKKSYDWNHITNPYPITNQSEEKRRQQCRTGEDKNLDKELDNPNKGVNPFANSSCSSFLPSKQHLSNSPTRINITIV
jgi:hypothetical protein